MYGENKPWCNPSNKMLSFKTMIFQCCVISKISKKKKATNNSSSTYETRTNNTKIFNVN